MERVSLTPLTHSDLDRPTVHWWTYLVPPLRRVPAWALHASLAVGEGTWRATRWIVRRSWRFAWPLLATPWGDVPAGPMPVRHVLRRAARQTLWLVPGILAVSATATYLAAWPQAQTQTSEPARPAGLYAERVTLAAEDGVTLDAVWIPATRPQHAGAGDTWDALARRLPAVVLVHDAGHDVRQMLPHARLLHARGVHVLVLETRSAAASPQTFGHAESADVAAAVRHLRQRPTVDAACVAAWGVGYGATAVANADVSPPLALAVLEREPDGRVDTRVLPAASYFDPLRPLCGWMLAVAFDAGPRPKPTPPLLVRRVERPAAAYDALAEAFRTDLVVAR